MKEAFRFVLGIGRHPWASGDTIIEVTIPAALHDQVAHSIGSDKMERLEFGFRFQQIVEELFPVLHAHIRDAITEWVERNLDREGKEEAFPFYSLQSPWFGDM